MIINQSVGFAFIHIPKSAGTSVTQFLSRLNSPLDLELGGTVFGENIQPAYAKRYNLRKHSSLAEAQATIAMARPPADMFIFTFVRNPYARLASIFSFLRQWQEYNPDLLLIMRSFTNFQEFVASGLFMRVPGPDGIFRPQCNWLKIDNQVSQDVRYFRIEEVAVAIETIRQELVNRGADVNLLLDPFPQANRSRNKSLDDVLALPDKLVTLINSYYAEDFSAFGYRNAGLTDDGILFDCRSNF
ncbi:hypothetical protein OGCDGJMD_02403 [Cyanobium usitatum str. Tous]|uniref:sulfotransferase family 2 domain-containing protein n=1 Tax=Cyanobium usitatum TaxID=2304190 RepID=UPI002AD41476|nr:sulfotransferase family 2 domain-containing protein [Cyanobium usitatum]CAK6698176.1 hypothetical protein OGCDGJMD_02403 [Cyanobium usitatum str. Tous]